MNSAYRGETSRQGWTTEADYIEGQRTDAATLAHHYGQVAIGGETAKAIAYARRAGDIAMQQLAHDEAALFYGNALDLLMSSRVVTSNGHRY